MKKIYIKPTMQVAEMSTETSVLLVNSIQNASTNLSSDDAIMIGGGGSGSARARRHSQWDDDENILDNERDYDF